MGMLLIAFPGVGGCGTKFPVSRGLTITEPLGPNRTAATPVTAANASDQSMARNRIARSVTGSSYRSEKHD